ncbi:acyltransferase [Vibrio rumoiensis]|uniref:acyltransferase n=1 Tax=Vibrio rumoiensis TaxID=76258 RepID=UPI003AA7CCE1
MVTVIRFLISCVIVIINTALASLGIFLMALVKWVIPISALQRAMTYGANRVMWLWASINNVTLNIINPVEWQIEGGEALTQQGWYLVICNHQSWADIVVLCSVLRNRIPMPKFFLKYELLYVPFVGLACWALDMPFMRRYSKEYLAKHPDKKGQDLQTTRRSCAKFQHTPTTVVNYVEGTRHSYDKAKHRRSPYQHLLSPKSGGIAYTLAAMGEQFEYVVDVTLAYPDNIEMPFRDMLTGKLTKIVVKIDMIPMSQVPQGDYFNQPSFKREFQAWLSGRWKEKDQYLDHLYHAEQAVGSRLDKVA